MKGFVSTTCCLGFFTADLKSDCRWRVCTHCGAALIWPDQNLTDEEIIDIEYREMLRRYNPRFDGPNKPKRPEFPKGRKIRERKKKDEPKKDSEWVSCAEAARRCHVSRQAVYDRIKRGTLGWMQDITNPKTKLVCVKELAKQFPAGRPKNSKNKKKTA